MVADHDRDRDRNRSSNYPWSRQLRQERFTASDDQQICIRISLRLAYIDHSLARNHLSRRGNCPGNCPGNFLGQVSNSNSAQISKDPKIYPFIPGSVEAALLHE